MAGTPVKTDEAVEVLVEAAAVDTAGGGGGDDGKENDATGEPAAVVGRGRQQGNRRRGPSGPTTGATLPQQADPSGGGQAGSPIDNL